MGLPDYVRAIGRRLGIRSTQEQVERALTIRTEAHRQLFKPRADALATLTRLRISGFGVTLISNANSEVPPLWHASPLAPLVDVHVFSCTEHLMKPDRRIFELTAKRLGVETRGCLYVGDGADDELEGTRAAGMTAVLLRPGDTTPPFGWSGPEIASLSQLLAYGHSAS